MEPTAPAGRRPGSADITAVVADDDRAFRDRLVARLRSDDWRVLVVGTAQEALDTCAHDAVDVVISSSRLPDRSGGELCTELRSRCATPVMLLTDQEPWEVRVSLLESGADACVDRSGDLRVLLAQLRAVIR